MFCLKYYPFEDYINEADELRIEYRPTDRSLEEFLEKYKDKSIVIEIFTTVFDAVAAKLIKELSNKYPNIKVAFYFRDTPCLELVQEYEIPFFFLDSVTSIDQLTGFLTYKPTDMYICEELGFSLDKVSAILHDHNVRVRVYPNICQSSFSGTPSLKTFFIRPEDVETYSTFVDVFEFISTNPSNQKVIFNAYKDGMWFGRIDEIIPSFKGDLDSRYTLPYFGMFRSKCGKRCMYKPGSCNICERLEDVGVTFKENGIVIRKKRS